MQNWLTRIITREQNWSFHRWIVPMWERGEKRRAVMCFLNRLPQFLVFWGKGGDEQYDIEWADARKRGKKGCGDFFGPSWRIAWWREALHFAGGVIMGIGGIPMALCAYPALGYLATAFVWAFFFHSEMRDGAEPYGFNEKETFDTLAWTLGAAVVPTIMYLALTLGG